MQVFLFDIMHEIFMKRALTCAKKAAKMGEVPVGAVVVRNGEVISTGYNRRETDKNALLHAEIVAIDEACKTLGGWRLHKGTLYVTVEPCIMCAGAIINSRIKRVVYGAPDPRFGAMGSLFDANSVGFNHKSEVVGGVLREECEALMSDFFQGLRDRRK